MSYHWRMNGKEFIRKVTKYAKANGLKNLVTTRGKGGHKTLHLSDKRTTVQTGEIPEGTLNAMCKQLGIRKKDI